MKKLPGCGDSLQLHHSRDVNYHLRIHFGELFVGPSPPLSQPVLGILLHQFKNLLHLDRFDPHGPGTLESKFLLTQTSHTLQNFWSNGRTLVFLALSCFRSEGGEGLDDRPISGAPAEVALEAGEDVLNVRGGTLLEDPQHGHHHPGRAEAALRAVTLMESLLDRVES